MSDTPKTEESDKADTITRKRPTYQALERENAALREYVLLVRERTKYFQSKNAALQAVKKQLQEKLKDARGFNRYYRSALKAERNKQP